MEIAIIGTGYVGLVTGTCFAEMGVHVHCVDTDATKIERLRDGEIPIYEPGLDEMVRRNTEEGRLSFHTDLAECIDDVEIVFIAVGTPPTESGDADLKYVRAVAQQLGQLIRKDMLVVTKSTVPVGTSPKVMAEIRKGLEARGLTDLRVEVANNPEFLKEGNAIKDFMSPDRVVIGLESDWAKELLTRLYRPFLIRNFRVLFMDIPSSELTKYASNAMLATRISFMNQLANLADKLGADVDLIRQGMGADHRIGSAFLYAGSGYGGSCFPKDVQALAKTGEEEGVPMTIVEEVHRVNEAQKRVPYEKLTRLIGSDLSGKRIAVWGLAFKPETDDMREATSIVVIRQLIEAGAEVVACDPIAIETAKRVLPDGVQYTRDLYRSVEGADALLLLTEWKIFRLPNWTRIKELMRGDVVIDGRNIYDASEIKRLGLRYDGIGRR